MTNVLKSTFFALFIFALLSLSGCLKNNNRCEANTDFPVDEDQLSADVDSIDAYLEQNEIEAQIHPSGVRYVINEQGSGPKPTACNLVVVTYEGRLLSNGERFDGTDSPVQFPLQNLIAGWQIGLPLLKQGGTITLYLPSGYAYGPNGSGDVIPPDANLIFEITLF